jgi:hypothetical protein
MVRCSRILPALLLAVALASGAVLADPVSALGPRRSEMTALAPKDVLLRLWDRLSSLWSKNGCQVDPDGRCLPGTTSDWSWDRVGNLWSKNGCEFDPNGRCLSSPASVTTTGDNGCGIDPSGECGH